MLWPHGLNRWMWGGHECIIPSAATIDPYIWEFPMARSGPNLIGDLAPRHSVAPRGVAKGLPNHDPQLYDLPAMEGGHD